MPLVNGLVPSRFLTLTAHLVIVITIFWSRGYNVQASLPLQCSQEEYEAKDSELVAALSVTLGLFAIELAGFFSGVSMFNSLQSLLSTGAHASASIALLFFLFERLDSGTYWWIFAFCRWPKGGSVRVGDSFLPPARPRGSSPPWASAVGSADADLVAKRASLLPRPVSFPNRSSVALAAHCSAAICLSFFVFERWETGTYWYIMGFCSALPAAVEVLLFVSVFGLKKKPL